MRWIGKILLWGCAIIGALVVLFLAALITFSASIHDRAPPIPDVAILSLDWDRPVPEHYRTLPIFEKVPDATVLETIQALDRAAALPQVKALVVQLGAAPIGFATAQELATAVRNFRSSGKKAYAYSNNLAAMGDGTPEYMLASSFDEIWMQPSGAVGLTGVALEIPYFAEGLSELGVEAEFEQRYEYKGGADPMTKRAMSTPVRQSLTALATGLLDQAVTAIADGRNLPVAEVRDLVDAGPYTAPDAISAGLIDHLAYADEFDRFVRRAIGVDARWIDAPFLLAAEADGDAEQAGEPKKVAVLYGIGPITGEIRNGPFDDEGFDSNGLVETLLDIADDNSYDAVLFRVSSPGGAYGPSDTVWHAVKTVREAGIPVVVSMSDIAASGGYFVSVAADRIVAHPATITGSIGVYGGKFDASALWDRLGVKWERVTAGDNAGMWTLNRGFDEAERDRFSHAIDFVYDDFTGKVATGRGFDEAKLDAVARGRVWLGNAAQGTGLVDRMGGFPEALDEIRTLLNLDDDALLDLTILPEPESPWEAAFESLEAGDFSMSFGQLMTGAIEAQVITRVESVMGSLEGMTPSQGMLTSPPMRLRR